MGQYTNEQRARGASSRETGRQTPGGQGRMQRRPSQEREERGGSRQEQSVSRNVNVQSENLHQEPENERSSQPQRVNNQIVIQNPGLVHLGSVYNMNIGQAFTQVNRTNSTTSTEQESKEKKDNPEDLKLKPPDKEFLRPLWYSKRVVEGDELLRLSKNIGKNWKSVGNGLKFNWSKLDQFESDTRSHSDAVHRMLYRWIQWKDQKATVGKLTKVLFNHKEYEAILSLTP